MSSHVHLPQAAVDEAPSLRRNYLKLPEVAAQSIGAVGASGGVGLLIPSVFSTAGNGTWLAYLFAAITLLFASWAISQFARRTASPGALYVYVARGLGPVWGIITGWALLVAYVIGAAGVLQGTVQEFLVFLQSIGLPGNIASLKLILPATFILTLVAWFISYRDIRLSTLGSLWIELITVALILVVIIGWLVFKGHFVDTAQITLAGVQPGELRLGVVLAFFSFTGFESAAVLGVESQDPYRNIPRAVLISIIGPGVLFLIASYGLVNAFQGQTPNLANAEAALATVAHSLHLSWLSPFINLSVALSFLAAFYSSINAGGRILYAFSRQGLLHKSAGTSHHHNATPHVAVTFIALFSLIVGLVFELTGNALFDTYGWLSTVATYGYLLAYALVAVGAPIYLRRLGLLQFKHTVVSAVLLVLLAIPLIGSVYPVPNGIYRWLPYVFFGLIGLGLLWFVILKLVAPEKLREIEEDIAENVKA